MGLRFEDIHYDYGDVSALRGITLEARAGEILCLLGRSGCGKSTLLNLAAGLLPVQSGSIFLEDALLASQTRNPPPEKRSVGLVFQDGALFPHLSVAENIGFGLMDRKTRDRMVAELLDQIDLPGMGERYPHTLSGGQQQRVAIARALAPAPDVLLMDEPFASIDISLRRQLREQTRRLVKSRNCATILVTHDPEEALEIADRIAVMEKGRITQFGTGQDLHVRPASLFVGMMSGSGAVLHGRHTGTHIETSVGPVDLSDVALSSDANDGDRVDILIRPHSAILIVDADKGLPIIDIRHTGQSQIVTLELNGRKSLLLEVGPQPSWSVGQAVSVTVAPGQPWPTFLSHC